MWKASSIAGKEETNSLEESLISGIKVRAGYVVSTLPVGTQYGQKSLFVVVEIQHSDLG